MDAPIAVKLSTMDGEGIVQPTPQRPRTAIPAGSHKPLPLLHRWASMSMFEEVQRKATVGSVSQKVPTPLCSRKLCCVCVCACVYILPLLFLKRCSPFAPVKEAKRLPPVPWFEQALSQSTTPTKSHDPSPMRMDAKSPRSLSVDTPPSSSKANSSLVRCMSMAELNSPDSQSEKIGDESRSYCLPIVRGARPESLKCISPETV